MDITTNSNSRLCVCVIDYCVGVFVGLEEHRCVKQFDELLAILCIIIFLSISLSFLSHLFFTPFLFPHFIFVLLSLLPDFFLFCLSLSLTISLSLLVLLSFTLLLSHSLSRSLSPPLPPALSFFDCAGPEEHRCHQSGHQLSK